MDFDEAKTYYDGLLHDFLNSDVTPLEQAVARFVDPLRATYLGGEDVEVLLWAAWAAVIDAAMNDLDGQDRLVDLLLGISAQGPLVRASDGQVCVIWRSMTVFSDLPVFGASMREHINIGANEPGGYNALLDENFVSFAARLTTAGIDFSLYAVWTYRECVETEPVDLTAFRTWHRLGGSELVRRLTELAAQPPPQPPPPKRTPEARAALLEAAEAWKARQKTLEAPEDEEVPEVLREAWQAWEAQQAAQRAAREAPQAREALRLIEELNRERRDE